MADQILRLPTVMQRCGLSRSAVYDAIRRGDFPSQVQLSARSVGWYQSTIDGWIAARPKKAINKAVPS